MMDTLIEARNLYKSFGETRAVDGLNLSVAAGEIYGLVGPDGAGKTTTIRLLCGALSADKIRGGAATAIHIAGYDLAHQPEPARAHIGYLPQRFSLYEELTVLENIRFFSELRGLSATQWRPRCMEILQFVGLGPFTDRLAGNLSGGMKQKLGLAAVLVHRPRILLLDEPTTGVDPVTRQDFWQLIIRLVSQTNPAAGREGRSQPVAVLVSTPYMDEAARCSRVGFMRAGQLLVEGTPSELSQDLKGWILELRGEPMKMLRNLALLDASVQDAQMFGDRIHLRVHPSEQEGMEGRLRERIVAQGGTLTQLRAIPPQLEDVFISLLDET